jgi:glutathione synthase/RimK-type ligase-like ATP-grasp enzyme
MHDLALFYEHPSWFAPLFAALDRRGLDWTAIPAAGHIFDPEAPPPARVILNRMAMSSILRSDTHPIFYAETLYAHWQARGARVINGASVIAIDRSKARQLALISALGLAVPRTRVISRIADAPAAAAQIGFPLVIKANIGGSGAGIARYDNMGELKAAIAEGLTPTSVDNVLLVQDYVPARDGLVTRIETLDGAFLYALDIAGAGMFDLCPADACLAEPGKDAIRMVAAEPTAELRRAAERIAAAVQLDVGGIEVMIDDRDGVPRFYDVNALSNFVAKPLDVLGWDPHDRLVDYLEVRIAESR